MKWYKAVTRHGHGIVSVLARNIKAQQEAQDALFRSVKWRRFWRKRGGALISAEIDLRITLG